MGAERSPNRLMVATSPLRTPAQLRRAIGQLPVGKPMAVLGDKYENQREHWLKWLRDYDGPGAYGRKVHKGRTAEYAYNHIVEWRMLAWLIETAGVDGKRVRAADAAAKKHSDLKSKSAAIRSIVPWDVVERALW